MRQAFGKKPGPGSFGGFLLDRGLSGKAVSGLYAGAGLAGAAVSILSAYLTCNPGFPGQMVLFSKH